MFYFFRHWIENWFLYFFFSFVVRNNWYSDVQYAVGRNSSRTFNNFKAAEMKIPTFQHHKEQEPPVRLENLGMHTTEHTLNNFYLFLTSLTHFTMSSRKSLNRGALQTSNPLKQRTAIYQNTAKFWLWKQKGSVSK